MATFSSNQTRHVYVATTLGTVTGESPVGAIEAVAKDDHLYFKYMGAGGQVRTDLIPIKNISSAKLTKASELARPLKKTKLTLDADIGEQPIVGEEYILRILFRAHLGLSDEYQHINYGVVQAFKTMTASDFYVKMVDSLNKNFSRGDKGLLKFELEGELDEYTGITIEELPQEWRLGTMRETFVDFTVMPTTVTVGEGSNKFEKIWGKVEEIASTTSAKNGKNIADLEYFSMGERGDVYRNVGWPYVRPTTYLVNPELEYDVIDIHYAFTDEGVGTQRSEKDITIVVPTGAVAASIVAEIDTLAGITVKK